MGKNGLIGLWLAMSASAAYAAEPPVCDSADHCVWIMENHGPHEFDYEVLSRELVDFGVEGKDFLLMLTGDKDTVIAGRALEMLGSNNFRLSEADVSKLLGEWPGAHLDKRANILVNIGTRQVQNLMIESLGHKDKTVREAARRALRKMRDNGRIYKLRAQDYDFVSGAVLRRPTREMVQMLAAFKNDTRNRTLFTRLLKSGETESVIAAYDGLFAQDKEIAFSALMATLKGLDDRDGKAALALGGLLRHRHAGRADGFYLDLAKNLAEDPAMSLMGRVAGLEAILGGEKVEQSIATTAPVISAFRAALASKGDDIHPYEVNFQKVAGAKSSDWASIIWTYIKSRQQSNSLIYRNFFSQIERFEGRVSGAIVMDALGQDENIPTMLLALQSVMRTGNPSFKPAVDRLTNHWADDVRHLARTTGFILSGRLNRNNRAAVDKAYAEIAGADNAKRNQCRVNGKVLSDYVVQLPFFTLEEADAKSFLKRRYIRAAYPTKTGWLTGFDAGELGGDMVFFDNKSGRRKSLHYSIGKTSAVVPVSVPAPGIYTSDFWVISKTGGTKDSNRLYRVSQEGEKLSSDFQRFLPAANFQISHLPDNRYLLRSPTHSPLVLSPDGQVQPACK